MSISTQRSLEKKKSPAAPSDGRIQCCKWIILENTHEVVTKVTEIEIEVWTCTDLLTFLNKTGHGRSRCAKMATVQMKADCGNITACVCTSTQ